MDRKTILVVEDNSDELMIYTTLLSFRGYAILAAGGFDEALRIAMEQRPDLAVIDVNLNDPQQRDGCDLLQALRADERTRRMPVIAHTAFGDVYRDHLDRVGCDSIVHKPSSPAMLIDTIEQLIGAGRSGGRESEGDRKREGDGEREGDRERDREREGDGEHERDADREIEKHDTRHRGR